MVGAIGEVVIYTNVNFDNLFAGATNSILNITNLQLFNQGDYIVVIINSGWLINQFCAENQFICNPLLVTGPNPSSANLYPGGDGGL